MAGNKDFIDIIREIRGSAAPGQPLTDGIWYELTVADKNGNPGVYGDILAKYGVVTESAGTFDQAVAILENLNVEITTLPAGSNATSALVNGVWQIGLPRGTDGTDGNDGNTPELTMTYDAGNIKYTVTVDGVVVTNTSLINLDALVDSKVSTNVGVQETLEAKQDVLDAVATAQGISDSLDANVVAKKQEIAAYTNVKINEIGTQAELEKTELDTHATAKVNEYNANALNKLNQYNDNHTNKLSVYNANNTLKLNQYNENHIERLSEINYAYADRIIEMIKTRNFMGIMDEYVAKTDTHMITFLDTTDANYIYYANGTLLVENVDYTVYNNTTIELTLKANPYDVIVQVNTQVLKDMLTVEGVLFDDRLGQPNGVASLNVSGKVPSEQLPSYVDDVIEVNTYADLPVVGESSKIYVVIVDETSNGDTTTYRWTGTVYAVVSNTLNVSDVKALYEANPDTNAYTDAEKSRIDINIDLTTTAQTLPTAVNEIDNRVSNIEDNTTLAEYGITDAYTKTEVQETLPAVGLDTTNTVAPTRPGQIKWNQNEGTADLVLNSGVTLQLGQENIRLVRNATLATIPNMTVCMFDGTLGNSGRIKVAPFTGLFNQSQHIYGIATQSINAGEDGYITIDGKVRNVNTTGATVGETWLDGDILYVKPNNAGHLTKVVPADDELKMPIASVIKAHVNGILEVRVVPFNENMIAKRANKWDTPITITLDGDVAGSVSVDGSTDVTIATTVQPNSVNLGTDTTGNYMVNVTAGSGISVSHTQGEGSTATITNSSPNVTTNITTTHTSTNVVVNSSDGTDGTINSATQTLAGVMSAADKTKLDGIEAGATGDQTASEILTLLKTVDGSGSGIDADLLDGQEGAYYLNASNINTGTISDSYLPDTITSDITGNAATTTKLATARTISLTGDVTGNVSFDGSANVSITATVVDDSHNHIISNVDGLQTVLDSKLGASANAISATKLQTARTIAGVSFDGTADISIPFMGISSKPTTVSGYGLTDVYTKTESNASLTLKVNSSEKGVANGIATLDANGKVILTQIPDSVLGQLEYIGTWNFTTFPTATQKGQYWIASVSGNGYEVGDWAVWNGTAFDKVDNTDAVATVAGRTGNVVLTKSDVGLSLVDNTADATKNVLSATKWTTSRTIALVGDVAGSVSVDGSTNVTITTTVQPNSVALGTDTTGNYVAGVTAGTGIAVDGTASEGWTPTISLANSGVTAGTYDNVTVDVKGIVTSATNNDSANISALVI